MMHLSVVPYQPGDIEDENHFRVEHHHTYGLSRADVMINGEQREVRCTSRQIGRQDHGNATILVHLKAQPAKGVPRLQCKFLDTLSILRCVQRHQRFPTLAEYVFDNPELNQTPGPRLIARKEAKLLARDLVYCPDFDAGHFYLSADAKKMLERADAGN